MKINKKLVSWLVGGLIVAGALFYGFKAANVSALTVTPEQYGLHEGDLIRATGDNDIFIVNQYGYKRLFLNPAIFNMYGHLGGWSNVKSVSPVTRDAFVTSPYFRADGDTKVYKLTVIGEDTGTLSWVNMSQTDFLAIANVNQIFTINSTELNWYPRGFDSYAPAHSVVTRSDNYGFSLPPIDVNVLELSVTAVGGDVKLASDSTAFVFAVSHYGMPASGLLPYTVLVDNEVYASGSWTVGNTFAPELSKDGNEVLVLKDSTKKIKFRFNFTNSLAYRGFKMVLTSPSGTGIESTQFYRESN